MDTTLEGSAGRSESFPTRPSEDLEHARILAAVNAKLFGERPLQIAQYQLLRMLGAGGMGEVFLARDHELGRLVALKILRSGIGGDAAAERLRNEAQTLARLSHPNVVQVHEFGQRDGRAYVVMEYVAGPTLTNWLASERRSRREILAKFRSAGEGLAAAHGVGVIHRDFKPDNVIVGDDGRIRVVDFGLAHVGDSLERDRAGTPRYMAPEQIAGGMIDARADQYAFCVALHEALWNVLPSPTRPRPPGADPRWLWHCIRRGLAWQPEQRWPDMASLLAALDDRPRRARALGLGLACVGGLVLSFLTLDRKDACVDAGDPFDELWNLETAEEIIRAFESIDSNHGPAAAERLLGGFNAWGAQWQDARVRSCRAREQGFSPLLADRRDACLDDQLAQVREHISASLDADARTLAFAWTMVDALPRVSMCEDDDSLRASDTNPAIDESELEHLRAVLHEATAERLAGHPEHNFEPLARARARAEQLEDPRLLAELLAEQAATEFMAGSRPRGIELLELAARKAYVARDDRLVSRLWSELSLHAVSEFDDADRAERWLNQAHDAWMRIDPAQQDVEMRASLSFGSGAVALQRGQLDEAGRELDRSLADAGPRLRPFVLERQGLLAEARGERERGLQLREQALAAAEETFGPLHPRTVSFGVGLGHALVDVEQFERARLVLARAFEAWRASDGRPQRQLVDALMVLCALEFERHDLDAALVAARQAEALLNELAPDAWLERADASNNVGTIEHLRLNYGAAAEAYARALALFERELGPEHPDVLEVRINSAGNLLALEQLDAAQAQFEIAWRIGPSLGLTWVRASFGLAEIELRRNAPARAQEWLVGVELDDEARPIDQFIHELLLALIELRLGRSADTTAVAPAYAASGEPGQELWMHLVENLNITRAERERLGLPPTSKP